MGIEFATLSLAKKYTDEKLEKAEIGNTIIDVVELPTENINEQAFYRLVTAKVVFNREDCTKYNFLGYCVDGLPEVGIPATNLDMSILNVYYNIQDSVAYGYIEDTLSAALGIPVGWYDIGLLMTTAGQSWGGVIMDISDDPSDGATRVLLNYDYYVYKNEWVKHIFAYEKAPKFDITWDGDMTGRTVIDMSTLGYDAGTYFVKVSDEILSTDDVIGGTYEHKMDEDSYTTNSDIDEYSLNTEQFPGAFTISDVIVVVQDEETLATALNVPAGFITNGVYYLLVENSNRTIRLTTPAKVTKIDGHYLNIQDDESIFHTVAFTGDYNSLMNLPTIYHDVIQYNTTQSLSSTQKSRARTNIDVYSKSEVDTKIANGGGSADLSAYSTTVEVQNMISNAIGSAIGGSY